VTAPARRALVTGASRGIGAAIAEMLRQQGTEVIAPIRADLDLSDPDSVQNYLRANRNMEVDILVNNAGINFINEIEAIEMEAWQAMLQVNLTAPMQLIQGFAPHMKHQGWGRIVNISSIFSHVVKEGRAAYSATKSGINGLTRGAAVELAPHGILVNAVCPGYVETEMTRANNDESAIQSIAAAIPLQRLARPEEIAHWVAFLCSEANSYMTGQTLLVDGGFTCR